MADMDNPTPTAASEALDILGSTPAERKIIQAISKMARSVTDIAISTQLPRTSLLYILNKLKKRQLVTKIRVGKRYLWKSDIQKPLRQLSNVSLSSFRSGPIYSNSDTGIIIHKGMNAITAIFEKLKNLPKNSRVYGLEPDNSIKYALRKSKISDLLRINEAIKNNKLIVEGIVHEKSVQTALTELGTTNAKKLFSSFIGRLEDYVKIPDEFANVAAEIWIFSNSAYIINWDKEVAIEIIDKDMVNLLIAMFSCVKESGVRYSQNKKMEIYSPK